MQPHHKPLSLWITMEKIRNLGKRVNFCLRLFSCNLTRSIWGTCFHSHLIPLYLLLSPLRSSEQQEIPRKQHGSRDGRATCTVLPPHWATSPHLTVGWSPLPLCVSWHSVGLDASATEAHSAHHGPCPFNIARLTLRSPDISSPWFPFLKLGISASPHGTHGLQAAGN